MRISTSSNSGGGSHRQLQPPPPQPAVVTEASSYAMDQSIATPPPLPTMSSSTTMEQQSPQNDFDASALTVIGSNDHGVLMSPSMKLHCGDIRIRPSLGLERDGVFVIENCAHEPVITIDGSCVTVHGSLNVLQQCNVINHDSHPTNEQMVTTFSEHGSGNDNDYGRKRIAMRRIHIPRRGVMNNNNDDDDAPPPTVELRMTNGKCIVRFMADNDNEGAEDFHCSELNIIVRWDTSLSTTSIMDPPFVQTQFIGPPNIEFKVIEVTEEHMRAVLLTEADDVPLASCEVHCKVVI